MSLLGAELRAAGLRRASQLEVMDQKLVAKAYFSWLRRVKRWFSSGLGPKTSSCG